MGTSEEDANVRVLLSKLGYNSRLDESGSTHKVDDYVVIAHICLHMRVRALII